MEILNEIKTIYPDFKKLKEIFSTINICDEIFLKPITEETAEIYFSNYSSYFLLYGELTLPTILFKWFFENKVSVSIKTSELKELSKVLKKNIISIEYDNKSFSYKYRNKEGKEQELLIKPINRIDAENKVSGFIGELKYKFKVPNEYLQSEIFEVFVDNGALSNKSGEKIIEIPKGKIDSIFNSASTVNIEFSDFLNEKRLVVISGENEEKTIKLSQLSITI